MIVGVIILSLVSILVMVIGWLLWKKEKITLLHEYHYSKVSREDKKAFCTLSGIGLVIVGIGIGASAVLLAITNSALSFLAFAVGLAFGLSFFLHAGKKYNA